MFSAAIGARLPDAEVWNQTYNAGKDCLLLIEMVGNPSLVKKKTNMDKLHYVYRGPMRKGLICLDRGMLLLKEPISDKQLYRYLRIVLRDLQNIVFIAVHANPIGGHFGLSQTVIRICMRFF